MSCLDPEGERSLSRQVSTDEAEKGWDKDQGARRYDDVHGLACSARPSENKPNSRSEQIDGWMEGGTQGSTKAPPPPPRKAPQPESWSICYAHAGPRPPDMEAPLPPQLEYRVQGATTHQADRRAHTHLGTQSHMLPGVQPTCNQRTGQYNDTQGPSLLLDRLSLQDPRQQTTVGRAENFCLGRLHLHRARPRRPLSLNLTTHGLLLLLLLVLVLVLVLLLLLPASHPAGLLAISLSVWQSVCLVCACSVPSTYTAKSSVPPP